MVNFRIVCCSYSTRDTCPKLRKYFFCYVGPAISGFAYSLEALSEEEDAEEEEPDEPERNTITQEQLAAALQVGGSLYHQYKLGNSIV